MLDKAILSADGKPNNFLQAIINTYFQGVTLLTIVHLFHTIMEYEKIIVLDSEEVKEFESPN